MKISALFLFIVGSVFFFFGAIAAFSVLFDLRNPNIQIDWSVFWLSQALCIAGAGLFWLPLIVRRVQKIRGEMR